MPDEWTGYDAWLEAPATDGHDDACDFCVDDERCHLCDEEMAAELAAGVAIDREEEKRSERGQWWDILPGDYNELTRERDGVRADAEADRRRQDLWGY